MPTIAEVRQQYPQYNDMSDADLAGALHKKFYSDMPVEQFNQKIGLSAEPPAEQKPRAWSDVPLEAVSNIPSSAYHTAAGLVGQAAGVAKTVAPYLAQGIAGPPQAAIDIGKAIYQDPDLLRRIPAAAWKGLVDRYGSEEAIKKTIATDPVGFGLDVATVLGGGEMAVSRIMRGAGEIGRAADVSRPFHELPPVEPATPPPLPGTPPPFPPSPVQAAIESQPRALTADPTTTLGRFQQQAGLVLSKIPGVGTKIGTAIEAVPGKFGEARNLVADEFGNYRTPQNVAGDIGGEIGGAAEAETRAAQVAARRTDEAAQAEYERVNREREQAIAQREQQSTQAAQQQIGDVAPVPMGDAIIDTVRANHEVARGAKDAAYADAGAREGTIWDTAVGNTDRSVRAGLAGEVELAPGLTKAANSMMASLRAFSERARQRLAEAQAEAVSGGGTTADAHPTGVALQDVETQRKTLNSLARNAVSDEDARAARHIMENFDNWQERSMQGRHYEGDPGALDAFQNARALNRDFRQRFGYNARNDADSILNKIVRPGDQIGPEDISKALFAGGNKPTRLLDAIYQATGDHPNHGNVVQAVRGGFWNKLAGAGEGATARPPERIASDINQFMNRREMADRLYTPEEQTLARSHAATLRGAEQAREEAAALAKQTRPVPTEVTKGPMQELADRVLGRGQKSEEALFDTLEGYAKAKGGGKDVATLADVMRSIPEELKGNFRNTFIRRLGTGLKGDFSPAKFADEWATKINPQAKAVLFGDGAHVRALDELAAASKKFDEVHRRFGNPSGSGQTINFAKIAGLAAATAGGGALALFAPVKLLGGWFAGRKLANFLATPAGAASASRFTTQMHRLQMVPTMANAAAARLSMNNMRNTATSLGIAHNIPDQPKR
jgi:hypothetical protein